jgi:hypothetical protein
MWKKLVKPFNKEKKMVKRIVLGLLIMAVSAGVAVAQESACGSSCVSFGLGSDFGLGVKGNFMAANTALSFEPGLNLDLYADGVSAAFMTENRFLAGLLNMPLGLWSWLNKDWLGGGITAGLAVGGVVLLIVASQNTDNQDGLVMALGGMALAGASGIYGFIRGFTYSKTLQAGSVGAISDNPLNHISLVVLPTFDDRNAVGAVTFSYSF